MNRTSMLWVRRSLCWCLLFAAHGDRSASASEPVLTITARVDLGEDLGQNFGTLFEATDERGRVLFGAGFPGVFNTRYRMDRFAVQFYVRSGGPTTRPVLSPLPRPSPDAGTYMFNLDNRLYSYAEGQDRKVRFWNEASRIWDADARTAPHRMRVGKGLLICSDSVEYDGRTVLPKPAEGQYYGFYYAGGRLLFYHTHREGDGGYTRLYSCPWSVKTPEPITPSQGAVLNTRIVGETPFCWGQLGSNALTVSNYGGIYVFDGRAWTVLREPLKGVSYQVYSALNYYDKLLLGQYPTGELFEYDGKEVRHLRGWPPRIAGVSGHAREAQTTALYGGDLFVGVWPWGEVWRYDRNERRWDSIGRLFTHPDVTDRVTHPYEAETIAAKGEVLNQWGQRITSMVPLGDSLYTSTSAKWHCQWEPKFAFLGGEKWKEYGQVWRLSMPGNLSASIAWKRGTTDLQFVVTRDRIMIVQDGVSLAETVISTSSIGGLQSARITWGHGLFGRWGGKTCEGSFRASTPPSQ